MKLEIVELNNSIEATKSQIIEKKETVENNQTRMTEIQEEVADAKVGFYSCSVMLIYLIRN